MNPAPSLKIILFILLLFFSGEVLSQQPVPPYSNKPAHNKSLPAIQCGTDLWLQQRRLKPEFRTAEEKMNREIAARLKSGRSLQGDTSYVLPVVVHIINDDPYSISDLSIKIGIKDLNDAFSKSGPYAASKGADTKISFCLANEDPDGGITNGITRTVSYFSNTINDAIEDRKLKNLIQWDPSRYINIWLVTDVKNEAYANFSCGSWTRIYKGAYATLPPNAGSLDGIVTPGFGVVMAHEMGHYLGLYHTFEGACNNFDCTTNGDRVCDTPPDNNKFSSPCGSPSNSCGTDTLSSYSEGFFPKDVPDQVDNFMDYGEASCQNRFTEGQAERMRTAIATQRPGLLVNKCDPPCSDNILASFKRDNPYPVPGDFILFTNTSTGASSYEWLVDDKPMAVTTDFKYQFNTAGKFKVTLRAFKNPACVANYTGYVIVNCGVTARFYADKRTIASKSPVYTDSILFTNTSYNATSFKWLLGNDRGMAETVVSTSPDLKYIFLTPGNYSVRLVATNGGCSDTSDSYSIPNADPTQDGSIYLYDVQCYDQTKVQAKFYVCNNGYATIPPKTPISFYESNPQVAGAVKLGPTFYLPAAITGQCCGFVNTIILDVKHPGLNQLWAVFNDSGNAIPVSLPNTPLEEANYYNNYSQVINFRFNVSATPVSATLEPGDTIPLKAIATPGTIKSYVWSPAKNLSCASCQSPNLIASTDEIKQVIATSSFNCIDTAYVDIKVPPANDYTITVDDVQCAGKDSVHINFTLSNLFKRGIIPKGLVVSFYNGDPSSAGTQTLPSLFSVPVTVNAKQANFNTVVKGMPAGTIYAVVNDSSKSVPVSLPNTSMPEKVYSNNNGSFNYKVLEVSVAPASVTLEPGDTITLSASGNPGPVVRYQWTIAANLSCDSCPSTDLIAIADETKKVVGTNDYGCTDTAEVEIKVPPADDFTIQITDAQCAGNDKLHVEFDVANLFKRGIIPKGLAISFYQGDPSSPGPVLLAPVFTVPNTINAKTASFNTTIMGMPAGTIYAVVNDTGKSIPVVLPNTSKLEKNYANNAGSFEYKPQEVLLQPSDTTVFRKDIIPMVIQTPLVNAASTTWYTGNNFTLSCTQCIAPEITVTGNSVVPMQTINSYGCYIKGEAIINIIPPDFTMRILNTSCYSNNTTLVEFEVCMNNRYDSIWPGIPVSFYDSQPLAGAKLLSPVFVTPASEPLSCKVYQHIVTTPATLKMYGEVNDKGNNGSTIPNKQYDETDAVNNASNPVSIIPFTVSLVPSDTMLLRQDEIVLVPSFTGGLLTEANWTPKTFLSCTDCISTIAKPSYTMEYQVTGKNENHCTDTASILVKTFTGTPINIPNAFTPNGDGLNDIFYVMAGSHANRINDFSIFNRWGEKIFNRQNVRPNDPEFGWNGLFKGQAAAAGAYVYAVTLQFENGQKQHYKGTVVLIR